MVAKEIYIRRRSALCGKMGSGLILIPGNMLTPNNYLNNAYYFRQDSSFLYYFGLNTPALVGLIDADSGEVALYGDDFTVEDIIWTGPQPSLREQGAEAGVSNTFPLADLKTHLTKAIVQGRRIHYLPPYRGETKLLLADLLGLKPAALHDHKSVELMMAVAEMREKKGPEEIEELENAIADLEDILKRPARINKIIMKELADVAKKYGKPRRCEIMYEVPAVEGEEPEQQIPDYPVHLFFTRDGYFKKITPQSLRMSGEQKLKDGDEVLFTCESTNSVELLFFTNHRQVYKSHAYDFNDSKASVLGDYVASALGMEEGEVPLYMVVTPDYKGWMLFFYDNGKCAKVPLSSYETKQNRRKLLKAYSDKAELAFMRHLPEETELAIFTTNNRLLLVGSALIPEKTTRDTAGVSVVALKKNAKIARVTLAEGLELNDAPRYRVRTLPAAGAILKADDKAEQLTL